MSSISMNDFDIIITDKGEYCLKFIANEIQFEYNDLFRKYEKASITRDELKDLLEVNKNDKKVCIFKKKLFLSAQNLWIKEVNSFRKKKRSKIQIDEKFILIWNSLGNDGNIRISPKLLKCLGFINVGEKNNNGNSRKGSKKDVVSEYIDFLKSKKLELAETLPESSNESIKVDIVNFKKSFQKRGIPISNYLLETQNLFSMYKSDKRKQEEAKNQKLINEQKRSINIIKNMSNFSSKLKTQDGYVYVATSKIYARENTFKVGITDNLKKRLSNFNTGRSSNDKFFYCLVEKTYNARKVELAIGDLLGDYKDRKNREMYIMHHTCLLPTIRLIIGRNTETYDLVINFLKINLPTIYNKEGTVPPEINTSELENNETEQLLTSIYRVLDRYIKKKTFDTTRTQLFVGVEKESRSKIKISEMWRVMRKNLQWKSKNEVFYKNHNIIIKYRS